VVHLTFIRTRRKSITRINAGSIVKKNKKNFKVGNIIKHYYQSYTVKYEIDKWGEKKFAGQEIVKKEETLLIIGHDGKSHFIVTPLGENITFNSRKYFQHGGFDKCF
jgi:hypothetical protein